LSPLISAFNILLHIVHTHLPFIFRSQFHFFSSSTEFNTEFLQITCLRPLFIGYRKPKSRLIWFSLGSVWTVAEGV